MATTTRRAVMVVILLAGLGAAPASAQVLGTFSWQLQPFCNVVTLTITQIPGGYTADGFDNQCGVGGQSAGVTGTARLDGDGSVGLGLIIVTQPSGLPVHLSATLDPRTGSGMWGDDLGNGGGFALGAHAGGSPRPVPAGPKVVTLFSSVTVPRGDVTPQQSSLDSPPCPAGYALTGGGAGWDGGVVNLYLVASYPLTNTVWRGAYRSERNTPATFQAYAICTR